MYRPLPDSLTIRESEIDGLGLFATKDICKGTVLGVSHKFVNEELVRTPLGGFYNHSNNPNCRTTQTTSEVRLEALRDIDAGEEITAVYTLCPMPE